jgi:hypothetical protein
LYCIFSGVFYDNPKTAREIYHSTTQHSTFSAIKVDTVYALKGPLKDRFKIREALPEQLLNIGFFETDLSSSSLS